MNQGQRMLGIFIRLNELQNAIQVGLGWKMGELTEADKEEILNKIK